MKKCSLLCVTALGLACMMITTHHVGAMWRTTLNPLFKNAVHTFAKKITPTIPEAFEKITTLGKTITQTLQQKKYYDEKIEALFPQIKQFFGEHSTPAAIIITELSAPTFNLGELGLALEAIPAIPRKNVSAMLIGIFVGTNNPEALSRLLSYAPVSQETLKAWRHAIHETGNLEITNILEKAIEKEDKE